MLGPFWCGKASAVVGMMCQWWYGRGGGFVLLTAYQSERCALPARGSAAHFNTRQTTMTVSEGGEWKEKVFVVRPESYNEVTSLTGFGSQEKSDLSRRRCHGY